MPQKWGCRCSERGCLALAIEGESSAMPHGTSQRLRSEVTPLGSFIKPSKAKG